MVEGYLPCLVDKYQSWRRARTIGIESRFAHRHRNIRQACVILLPDALDVRILDLRGCLIAVRRVSVTLRGRHELQAFAFILAPEPRQYGRLAFAVDTPMRPEKEEDGRSLHRRKPGRPRSNPAVFFNCGRSLSHKEENVQILLKAGAD